MGKTVAYIATAILLGTIAMLPVIVFTPKTADQGYYAVDRGMNLLLEGDVEKLYGLEDAGTVVVPSGPFHIGLIVVLSFVCAFGVSFYFKRKMF